MLEFRLSEAALISTTIEAMLYGVSVLMFTLTWWLLQQKRRLKRESLNRGMILAAFGLLVLSTAEMIVNIIRICQGFLNIGPSLPGGPEAYFANVSELTFVLKSVLYNAQTLILDGVVIYRAYKVWQRIWIVVVPIMGWCGLLASSIGTNFSLATASTHASDVFAVQTGRWITATYATTLATNLISTALLAYRIWTVNRRSAEWRTEDRLGPILRVVIESGAIYSMTITAGLITFVVKTNGVYLVLDLISPIICIVFNMIIFRIGITVGDIGALATSQPTMTYMGSEYSSKHQRNSRDPYELRTVQVEVTTYQETDVDSKISSGREPLVFAPV